LGKPQARQKYRKGVGFNEQQKGAGRSLARKIWRAGGTPKTHLVPLFCGAGAAAVATKHFLSALVTVHPFLVMSPYLSTAFVKGDVTGKNTCLYGLIKRGSGRIHTFKPERGLCFEEPG